MSTNVNLHHIVFRTKNSLSTIPEDENRRQMLAFINEDSKRMECKILRINGHRNHIHILVDLHSDVSVAEYVKTIKADSSRAFNGHKDFPLFRGWAKKYGSFTVSRWDKDKIIEYIKNQDEHHSHKSFIEELIDMFGKDAMDDVWWRYDWLDEPKPTELDGVPPALITPIDT